MYVQASKLIIRKCCVFVYLQQTMSLISANDAFDTEAVVSDLLVKLVHKAWT